MKIPDLSGINARIKESVTKTLGEVLEEIKSEVISKSKSGVDYEGNAFPNYSKSYEEFKRKSLGQSGTPNLTKTGEMLESLTTEIEDQGQQIIGKVKIGGAFNQDKARWNQGVNPKIPARRFMGIGDNLKANIIKKIKGSIITK